MLAKIGSSARRVFTTGERFGAETAQRIGLVDEISEDVEGEAERIVGELLTSGAAAARAAKRLVLEPPAFEDLPSVAARMRTSDEGQEGLRAFLDKRPADAADGAWGVFAPKRDDS